MTETIKLPSYYEPDRKDARYGSIEELKELLLKNKYTYLFINLLTFLELK